MKAERPCTHVLRNVNTARMHSCTRSAWHLHQCARLVPFGWPPVRAVMYTTLRRPSANRRSLWLVFVRVSQSDGGANWDDSGHAMPSTPLPVSPLDRLKINTIEIQQQPKSQANDHPHAATTANATQFPLSSRSCRTRAFPARSSSASRSPPALPM